VNIHFYDSLESTNNTAKEMVSSGAVHGTVIIADRQTGGRGRFGRSFFSPSGSGIYLSFILDTDLFFPHSPALSTVYTAVCVCEAIEILTDKEPQIKWVNDIFIDGKKVCGILVESITNSDGKRWLVVGIGLNFSVPAEGFPLELQNCAGALFEGECPVVSKKRFIDEIVGRFLELNERYSREELIYVYKRRLMILGKEISVVSPNGTFFATAIDVDCNGGLVVRMHDGAMQTLSFGEISIA